MSSILQDYDIEVIEIRLKSKIGSDTLTFNIGLDYWEANTLYSGSGRVYPVLVTPPEAKRGIGNYIAIRQSVDIQVYAKTDLFEAGKTIQDLRETWEFHNAQIKIYYYSKSYSSATTNATANLRQLLEVESLGYDDTTGIMTVRCRDRFFKDTDFNYELNKQVFPDLEDSSVGLLGSFAFGLSSVSGVHGEGIIIDAPIVESKTQDTYPRVKLKLFTGWDINDVSGYVDNFRRVYVQNVNKNKDTQEWLSLGLESDPKIKIFGNASVAGGTALALYNTTDKKTRRAIHYKPTTVARIINRVYCPILAVGTPVTGKLSLQVYFAELNTLTGNYETVGSPIRESIKNYSGTSYDSYFNIDTPLVCSTNEDYLFVISWDSTDTTNYFSSYVVTEGGSFYFEQRDNLGNTFYKVNGVRCCMELFAVGYHPDGFSEATYSGGAWYSSLSLMPGGHTLLLPSFSTEPEINKGLNFRVAIDGIKSSPPFVTTAGDTLNNPASIVHVLMYFYLTSLNAETQSLIDSASITEAKNYYNTYNYTLEFGVRDNISALELLIKICQQTRLVVYKKANGNFALKVLKPVTTFTERLSEAASRADLTLLGVADDTGQNIVNDFRQGYDVDMLSRTKELEFKRLAKTDKYNSVEILNANNSTGADLYRQAICSTSQTKFDKRELTEPLDCYDNVDEVRRMQQYYCDRFTSSQKIFEVRILRKNFYNRLEILDTIELQHSGINNSSGSSMFIDSASSGDRITWDDEGLPVQVWSGGEIQGEVIGIREVAGFMTLECRTVPKFFG